MVNYVISLGNFLQRSNSGYHAGQDSLCISKVYTDGICPALRNDSKEGSSVGTSANMRSQPRHKMHVVHIDVLAASFCKSTISWLTRACRSHTSKSTLGALNSHNELA